LKSTPASERTLPSSATPTSLSIGELAERTGVPTSALRYYDELGLVQPAGRAGGRRRYAPSAVRDVSLILFLREIGFSLAEIGRFIAGDRHAIRDMIDHINVLIAPLAALVAMVALPPDDEGARRRPLDFAGSTTAALALFMAVFAMTEGPEHGWLANRGGGLHVWGITLWSASTSLSPIVPAVAIAVSCGLLFVAVERRTQDPLVDLSLFASRHLTGGLVTAATVVMAQAGAMFVLAVFLQSTHHLTPAAAGRWILPVGVAVLVGAQMGGGVAARIGPARVVRVGILVQLAGVILANPTLSVDTTWATLAGPLLVFGIGAGLASSQLTSVILTDVGREQAGAASGLATTSNSLAAALGIATIGTVLRSSTSAANGHWALAAAAVLLAVGAAASGTLTAAAVNAAPTGSTVSGSRR
jgi:hypothetical protein